MEARVNTAFGVLADELGHAASEVLTQGPYRPELRRRAWASPALQYRSVQDAVIPVDLNHDGWPVGQLVYLERARGRLWAVAHLQEHVTPAVQVRVAGETVSVEHPLYWSASRFEDEEDGSLLLESVALTPRTARVMAQPVKIVHGTLDYPGVTARWQLEPSDAGLLERAVQARRERPDGALIVHDADEAFRYRHLEGRLPTDPEVQMALAEQDYQRPDGPIRHGRVVRNSVLSVR
jgi:hypothetical protein